MALFLTRSALCIGAVAVAASGAAPVLRLVEPGGRRAATDAGRACLASPGCFGAASAVAASIAGAPSASRAADATGAALRGAAAVGRRRPPAPRP